MAAGLAVGGLAVAGGFASSRPSLVVPIPAVGHSAQVVSHQAHGTAMIYVVTIRGRRLRADTISSPIRTLS